MFPERQAHKASCIRKTLLEVELGCEGCRDISEKKEGEGRGDEDTLFYCEGTERTNLCVWKGLGLKAVELDEMTGLEMERKVKPVLCHDSRH